MIELEILFLTNRISRLPTNLYAAAYPRIRVVLITSDDKVLSPFTLHAVVFISMILCRINRLPFEYKTKSPFSYPLINNFLLFHSNSIIWRLYSP